ncbi:hypothetical protein [Halocatena halophila]|uniref:hypothetical protein n=1 Tax=Halocatena halophila TaxID=2814576 RepID=UPI002ED18FD8
MTIWADFEDGVQIVRGTLRRELRSYTTNQRRLIGLLVTIVFYLFTLSISIPATYTIGQGVTGLDSIPYFGVLWTLFPPGMVGMMALLSADRIATIEASDLVLMIVHPRGALLGLLGTECIHLLLWFGLPAGLVGGSFMLGANVPSALLVGGTLVLVVLCWAAVWGYALGIGTLRVLRRVPRFQRLLKILWAVVIVAVLFASQFIGRQIVSGLGGRPFHSLAAILNAGPFASFGALTFVGTPVGGSASLDGLAILAVLVLTIPVGLGVSTHQARSFWFRDRAPPKQHSDRQKPTEFEPPWPLDRSRAGHVAWGLLLRAKRTPQKLAHLQQQGILLIMAGPLVFEAGLSGGLLAALSCIAATQVAGAAFCANPLGDDRPLGTLLFLTDVTPRALARGRMLAGLVLTVPVAVIGSLLTIAIGTPPLAAISVAFVGAVLCLPATGLALGLGSLYPIFEEREVFGTEAISPSFGVLYVYEMIVLGGTVIGLWVCWVLATGTASLSLGLGIGLVVYGLFTTVIPYAGYRYAVGRLRSLTIE